MTSIIIQALERLASLCDGAKTLDSQGYNKADSWRAFHILDLEEITPEIEWIAWDMLRKYKEQLSNIGFDYDSFEEPSEKPVCAVTLRESLKNRYNTKKEQEKKDKKEQEEFQDLITNFKLTKTSDGRLSCQFPFNPKNEKQLNFKNAIKDIPKARFCNTPPSWLIPFETKSVNALKKVLEDFGITVTKEMEELLNVPTVDVVNTATLVGNNIHLKFEYDPKVVAAVKNIPHARWNQDEKFWKCPVIADSVQPIKNFLNTHDFKTALDIFYVLDECENQTKKNYEASLKQESDLHIEGLNGNLKPFQKAGVEYMTANPCTLLADEMGLGKTVETIAAIEHNKAYPAVIVCPASLKLNWLKEIKKWVPHRQAVIFDKTEKLEKVDFVILNYQQLKNFDISFVKTTLVLDECHRVKNHKAQCTKFATELSKNTKFRYLLSGIPMVNRPAELISQLTILGKLEDMGGFWGFVNKYCNPQQTRYGVEIKGASNLEDLKKKLRTSCLIRREKKDVLAELPDMQRQTIPVEISNRKEYKQAERELIDFIKQRIKNDENFKKELKQQGLNSEQIREKILERANSAAQRAERAEALVRITTLKQVAAKGKIEKVSEWLDDFVETGKKLVIFVTHIEIMNEVKKILQDQKINVVTFSGQDSLQERENAKEAFQNDPNCQVIICMLQVGGVGITLTAASDVAFLEVGWRPDELDQAEDRLHRMGQKDAVNCYYFHAENTIDDYIYNLIEQKREIVDINVKKEEKQKISIVNELWNKLLTEFTKNESNEEIDI